ncbi:MAG: response regulator, partial [Clostridia bacterium]|nr:response regulator [Clostridia bacterium]
MQKRRIYLLSGSEELNAELKKLLTDSGEFEVVGTAIDGQEGLKAIEEKKPSLVVTELVLSGVDGLYLIEKIGSMGLGIKTIVLSALSREETIRAAMAKGASYYMVKPFNFS